MLTVSSAQPQGRNTVAGNQPDTTSLEGSNELFDAVSYGNHLEVLKLIVAGANVNERRAENAGMAPLHMAVAMGHIEIVKTLLTVPGIDINIQINRDDVSGWLGQTSLFRAAYNAQADIVDLLLSQPKIDVNKENDSGDTALGWAYRNGPLGSRITSALRSHGAICGCKSDSCRYIHNIIPTYIQAFYLTLNILAYLPPYSYRQWTNLTTNCILTMSALTKKMLSKHSFY